MKLEVEKTYAFLPADSKHVIQALFNMCNNRKKIKQSDSLHILIPDERRNYKKRLKLLCKKSPVNPVAIMYSPKIRIVGPDNVFQTYLEENIEIQPLSQSGVNFFPVRFFVNALYFKHRLIFLFNFAESKVRIAVDQIVALNPLDINQKTEPYFNMEVECFSGEAIDMAMSLIFDDNYTNYIRLIDFNESKSAIASALCPQNTSLYFKNYTSLVKYVQKVEKECFSSFLQFKLFDY